MPGDFLEADSTVKDLSIQCSRRKPLIGVTNSRDVSQSTE